MKLIHQIRIKNRMGLHTRPATTIVQLLQTCDSDVHFTYRRETINARSILSILTLAATCDTKLTITVDGNDAQETLQKLVTAFENKFEECQSI